VPLSDHEQRILDEIERQFRRNDPQLAAHVENTTVYRDAARHLRYSVLGFVVGLAVMVGCFSWSLPLGLLGFAIMLVAALWFERHLRRMGKAGLQAMRQRVAQSKVVSFRFPPRGDSTRGE
jgi:uncharacterized membrane protein